jgi:pimeloyl-ACP methyl ester carboxylesterase
MKYDDLPEVPPRPHNYFALESVDVSVKHPQRSVPVNIHCKVLGKGPPLLLVHGLMTSSYSFRYIIPALAEKYQVIAPDLPGAGKSEAPLDLSMSPQSIAMLICALIKDLQIEPPYVVGNSLGGYQTLWLAVLFPEQVRKLIVMHAPGFPQLRNSVMRFLFIASGSHALVR